MPPIRLWLTGSGAIALAVNSAAAGQTVEPPPVVHAWPKLHTPDQITPAVLPYLACLYAQRGLPPLHSPDGATVAFDKNADDCSAARARARSDAAKLLEGQALPAGSSGASLIERTLADIDTYVASLPVMGKGGAGGNAAVGIPLTIEDEVLPAYARYDDCLKTQVSESWVTVSTIMAKFQEAMGTCRSVRDDAVAQATKALASKGWDEDKRRRTAETTFAKVDESWMAIGLQYRAALAQRAQALEAARWSPQHK